jgi:hypothetical protein
MLISWSPHQTNIAWRDVSTMRTQVFRLSGQCSGGPSGDCDQSLARISALSSLSPANKAGVSVRPRVITASREALDLVTPVLYGTNWH